MPPHKSRPQKKACDACYQRKTQCLLPEPNVPCEWCSHREIDCTFDRERPRKKRRKNNERPDDEHEDLMRRIAHLEEAIAQTATPKSAGQISHEPRQSTGRAASSDSPSQPATTLTAQEQITPTDHFHAALAFAGTPHSYDGHLVGSLSGRTGPSSQLGPNWFFNGIPLSSDEGCEWIASQTGQNVTQADFSISTSNPWIPSFVPSPLTPELYQLPDQDVTREALSAFFGSPFRLSFPVLDQELFQRTMKTAYEPVDILPPTTSQLTAGACVLSALSLVCRLKPSGRSTLFIDGANCCTRAYSLLMHSGRNKSLEALQVLLIIQLQSIFSGYWHEVSLLHSIVCQMVYTLKGHIFHPSRSFATKMTTKDRETRHCQTIFWVCYMLDKDFALRMGNPPLLSDTYCDITPPDDYLDFYIYLPTLEESIGSTKYHDRLSPHFAGDIHLSHLKEKVYCQLFSARVLSINDDQLLSNIRELDDNIEQWRLSIPVAFRPVLFVAESNMPSKCDSALPHLVRRLSLQLEYHHLMILLHTTVRRCSPDDSAIQEDLHEVVHSSFDLSLVASRSTLRCLQDLFDVMPDDAYRFMIAYSMTAAMSLFLNTIIHPLDTQARTDLELIMAVTNTMRRMIGRMMSQAEVVCVHEHCNIVMRLARLGTCAVRKAEKRSKNYSPQK